MSIKVELNTLSNDVREKIVQDLKIQKKENQYNPVITYIYSYEMDDKYIYLPFRYATDILKIERPIRENFAMMDLKFSGKLRKIQRGVKEESLKLLKKNGSCIISMYTGGGKTFISIYLSLKIKLRTLIIISRIVLIDQWKSTIEKASPGAIVQVLTTKTKINENADFYIMNAINVSKKSFDFFKKVGTLIVDEVHLIATEILSKSLSYVCPRYTIGLSATPTRSDGMDVLLNHYFGENKIYRKLHRKHFVYKVKTEFEPEFGYGKNGKIDWNSVLESQCNDEGRNEMIIKIVRYFSDRVFLILCKRVSQANYLCEKLKKLGEDVTSLIGVQKYCNYDSRVLVATIQKAGVGFDHPKLNTLLLASDVEGYFIQYLGRVMRTETVEPYIFDLVDNNGILKKHYYTRRRVYLEHGGIIKDFEKIYPNII